MGIVYKCSLRPGSRIKSSAEEVDSVLAPLAAENKLTAHNLVDASRPADAPLHKEFEWDDAAAAEKYRESQARYIIGCVYITKVDDSSGEASAPTRAYVNFQYEADAPEYHPISVVIGDADLNRKYFRTALIELEAFRKKYANLEQFAKLFEEIDNLLAGEPE